MLLLLGVAIAAHAQTLLYQWTFTNSAATYTNSPATYAVTPGTGNLLMANVAGNAIGTTGADALNPSAYFTNTGAGPGSGPGVNATGAFVANGQGYNGGNTAIALVTNLNLGALSQFTVTYWVKMGSTVPGQFPRLVQVYQTPAYDVGGKGSGNHNGFGTSVNGSVGGAGKIVQEQNGIANSSLGQQNPVIISNTPAGNPALPNGYVCDGATWYYEAVTYDGSQTANNFTTWIGTLSTNIVAFTQSANYSSINFTTNATIMIGGNNVNGSARSLSTGAIADVRIYSGVLTSNMLENIRNFLPDGVIPPGSSPASITTQPASGSTFVGGSRTFNISAAGNPAVFKYLWRSNSIAITSATNSTLTLTNIQLTANGASFVCSVTNFSGTTPLGGTNSTAATLTVVAPTANSYAQVVFTNNPFAFWQVNEPSNTTAVTIFDYANGNDGSATTPARDFFVDGPLGPLFPGFPSVYSAIESRANNAGPLNLPTPTLFPNTGMTICGWVNAPGLLTANGLIFDLISDTAGGFGLQAGANDGTRNQVSYQWGATSVASGLYYATNEWTFIALTITTNLTQADIDGAIAADTNAIVCVGSPTVGFQLFTNSTVLNGTVMPSGTSASPLALGRTTLAASENGGSFYAANTAAFSSVAVFYKTLSAADLQHLYLVGAGIQPPILTVSRDPSVPGNILLTWNKGTLQEATSVTGTYTDVAGPPTSPYSVAMGDPQHYYRVRN